MSTPQWVKSRLKNQAGFSIAAAVVSAAILTVVAIAIQMTVPSTVDPRSQGAATANGAVASCNGVPQPQDQGSCDCSKAGKWECDSVSQVCQPGKDYEIKLNKTTGKIIASQSFEICPPDLAFFAVAPSAKARVGCDAKGNPVPIFDPKTVCTYPPSGKLKGPWVCKYRFVDEALTDPFERCQIMEAPEGGATPGRNFTPAAPVSNVPAPVTPDQENSNLTTCPGLAAKWDLSGGPCPDVPNSTNKTLDDMLKLNEADKDYITKNCAEGSVVSDECARAIERNVDTVSKLNSLAQDNQATLAKNCDVERNGVDTEYQKCTAAQKVANDNYAKISQALKNDIVTTSPDGCPLGATKDSEGNCKDAKGFIVGCNDPGGCKKGTEEKKPGNETKTPPYSGPTGTTYTTGGNNPQIGAGSGVQSPFGGACNTRYVCQGNMLYYQSQNGQQCMTQPMQQCQYGCQQVANGQTGQTSTLGTITQLLPVVTSVMRMFGGGSSNSATTMANPNLSSSCATQQQQQQGQYGTGTNGQACTQPPQQPDPAQCTSGTWKATSAQQNGCTTGWQCVSGTGTGGTQPTAQLSCQPQVADVGMQIGFSWSCGNSSGSAGTGFDTGGQLSGNTTSIAPAPPADSSNTAVYTLTCVNQGVTASAQCQVQIGKSGVVLIANPQQVRSGETSQIGWITAGMKSCVVSSPDQNDFTQKNAATTNVNGAAQSSPITKTTVFKLDCVTVGGLTKSVTTTVGVN